jgi:hypothetical protein
LSFPSPNTRLFAKDWKATQRPVGETAACQLKAFPCAPAESTLARVVTWASAVAPPEAARRQ